MSKKLLCTACLVFVLSLASIASAELVAHWPFDDGSGTVARDVTGNGNDGTLNGDPQWVSGMYGVGLEFDGDDFVDCGNNDILNFGTNDWTITAWIQTTQIDRGTVFANGGDNGGGVRYTLATHEANADRMTLTTDDDSTKAQALGATVVIDGQWYHVAAMRAGTETRVYVNGVLDGTNTVPAGYDLAGTSQHNSLIGAMTTHTDGSLIKLYIGIIDDVRIYNTALTESELQVAMQGQAFTRAKGPVPEDGSLYEDTWANMSWSAGDFAVSHDVYLSDNLDDVDNGTGDAFRGNQIATDFVVGFPGFAYPDGLVPGTTYYWRIDEVNEADPNSPWRGDIWSFSIPPKTAYFPDPTDGAQFVDLDAALSWTPGFGAKLHTVYIGDSFEDVNNAAAGAPRGTATYKPASPLEAEKVYYWRVDEFDIAATHKGDIWSFTTPGAVGNPQPANGAADVSIVATLNWTPADSANSSDLYFGADADAVRNATAASPEYIGNRALGSEGYDPGKLALGATYYWRVDAVYADKTVKGLLWSFTAAEFIGVDDFEAYNDIDPPDPNSNRIFDKWIDGFGTTTNGALVGNELPPYAGQTVVHSGAQAMPYFYDNNLKTSEATLTLVYPKDWTAEGLTRLSLWFMGDSASAPERMFVALNGTAVIYHEDPAATQVGKWTEWSIDLTRFADQGVNLANVNTITIGFGTRNSPTAGGSGQMNFDDIRLY
ncbi:MAG: LamG domain-containing protein [Planctomycetes bacterium]|nr:LamG domain-containing protein [Planctomycetota bacterium]